MDYNKIQGNFSDVASGSVDFHSFWHSICHLLGISNQFVEKFTNIRDDDVLIKQILESRGIYFSLNSTLEELQLLYDDYLYQLQLRGTEYPFLLKGSLTEPGVTVDQQYGVGYLHQDLINTFGSFLNLGVNHKFSFNLLFSNGSSKINFVTGKIFSSTSSWLQLNDGVLVEGNVYTYELVYRTPSDSLSFEFNVDITLPHKFDIYRYGNLVVAIVDNQVIEIKNLVSSLTYLALNLFDGNLPIIWDINVVSFIGSVPDKSYLWRCNEGCGFVLESNVAPVRSCYLSVDSITPNSELWVRDSRIGNNTYLPVNGEILRLFNYDNGEFLSGKINSSELGLTIDVSSFLSDSNLVYDLNKFYAKSNFNRLSRYPLDFTESITPVLSDPITGESITYNLDSSNTQWFGINSNLIGAMAIRTNSKFVPNGLIPVCPIKIVTKDDNFDGYEFSFTLRVDAECSLRFGLLCTDVNLFPKGGGTKRYTDNSNSQYIIEDDSFNIPLGVDVSIRGIISNGILADAPVTTNIGEGSNLYFCVSQLYYCFPIIALKNIAGQELQFTIKDLVFRPLTLNTEKGVIDKSDSYFLLTKNTSNLSENNVNKILENKFIPYSYNLLSQYI